MVLTLFNLRHLAKVAVILEPTCAVKNDASGFRTYAKLSEFDRFSVGIECPNMMILFFYDFHRSKVR